MHQGQSKYGNFASARALLTRCLYENHLIRVFSLLLFPMLAEWNLLGPEHKCRSRLGTPYTPRKSKWSHM